MRPGQVGSADWVRVNITSEKRMSWQSKVQAKTTNYILVKTHLQINIVQINIFIKHSVVLEKFDVTMKQFRLIMTLKTLAVPIIYSVWGICVCTCISPLAQWITSVHQEVLFIIHGDNNMFSHVKLWIASQKRQICPSKVNHSLTQWAMVCQTDG